MLGTANLIYNSERCMFFNNDLYQTYFYHDSVHHRWIIRRLAALRKCGGPINLTTTNRYI